ncbi:MAG: sigma-70 family RNA polymerase sigma factor [Clostridia bacterium]|nr:sigma-70 family RNA polymerase sigma factor [Clostridia bacterium]
MKEDKIIELFFARDEEALRQVEQQYGDLCNYVASNFLCMREDREECVNDTLLALWNSIPPERPRSLSAYISTLARNIAINKSRANNAWKRGGGVQVISDEALSMIPDEKSLSELYEARLAGEIVNNFLGELTKSERKVFILRYWFDASDRQIADQTGFSHSKIKSMLARLRKRLTEKLGKEGIIV